MSEHTLSQQHVTNYGAYSVLITVVSICLLQAGIVAPSLAADCNSNGIDDAFDIEVGTSLDCDVNGVPDDCNLQPVFSDTKHIGFLDRPIQAITADVDGDGDADVIAGTRAIPTISWFENLDGLGSFGPPQNISTIRHAGVSMIAADMDGDGDEDLLSSLPVSFGSSLHMVTWYKNVDGTGGFLQMPIIATNLAGSMPISAEDMDDDGDVDILAGLRFNGDVAWFENTDGAGNFGPARLVSTNTISADSVQAVDLDGDGDKDVVAADNFYSRIVWYENLDGLETFSARKYINDAALEVDQIVAIDIDGDGDADIASAGEDRDKIAWYENTNGMAAFGPQQVVTSSASHVSRVAAADIDRDGYIDLLWASEGDAYIAYFQTVNGEGSFTPPQVINYTAINPSSVVAADLDRDGDLDVLAASVRGDTVSWHESITFDCNQNAIPDECDLVSGTSLDCNSNGTPDECEPDCNASGFPDECDITDQSSNDCNSNGYPDECELDCNQTGLPDDCDVANQTSVDCNFNSYPDECELVDNDCDSNAIPDDCTLTAIVDSMVGPVDTFPCPNLPAELTVSSSVEGLDYRWFKDDIPMIDSVDATGTNSATLTFPSVNMNNVGRYFCEISIGCIGTVSDTVSVLPLEALTIVGQPAASTAFCAGNTVGLTVTATGEDLTYEWLRNGIALPEQPGKHEGVDTPTLNILDAGAGDLGEYICVVRDSCGAEESTTPSLLQIGDPTFVSQPLNQCVSENGAVSYTSVPEGGAFPVLKQWYKDGVPLNDGGHISGSLTDTLEIQTVSVADEGSYTQRALAFGPNCIAYSDPVYLEIDACICNTPGDIDADGDMDLVDLQVFMDCFGARVADRTGCACANLNAVDAVINSDDWTAYPALLTGP